MPRVHLPAQCSAFFDGQPLCLDFTSDVASAPKLNFFTPADFSFDAPAHDHFARGDVGFHAPVRTYGQAGVADLQLAFYMTVNEKIFATVNLALDPNSLADARHGTRRDWKHRRIFTRSNNSPGTGCDARLSSTYVNFLSSLQFLHFFFPHRTPRHRKWDF